MTTALQTRPAPSADMQQWQLMTQQARVLLQSGFLPKNITTEAQAIAVMQKGHELGIPAMYALSNVIIQNGKTSCSAELMLALIYRDHGDGAILFETTTPEQCVISYARRGWSARKTFRFSVDDAKQAQLITGTNSGTWGKYPGAMLRARCVSAVARMSFPDSIAGMYTPEELDAPVQVDPATGEIQVIDSPAREVPAQLPSQDVRAATLDTPALPSSDPATDAAWEELPPAAIRPEQLQRIANLLESAGQSISAFCTKLKIADLSELSAVRAERAIAWLADKAADRAAKQAAA